MEKGKIDVIEILEADVKHETECVRTDSTLCLYDPEKRQPSRVIVLIVFTSIIMSALFYMYMRELLQMKMCASCFVLQCVLQIEYQSSSTILVHVVSF